MNEHSSNEHWWAWPVGVSRWWVIAGVLMVTATQVPLRAADGPVAAPANAPLHLGFSAAEFAGINENDAKAALKIWAQTILTEHGVASSPETLMLEGQGAIIRAVKDKTVDAVTLTTEEYSRLDAGLMATNIILGANAGVLTEEYLLLVHHDSNLKQLADLRGRNLVFYENPRASLAPVWLETLLLQAGLGEMRQFCDRVSRKTKLSQVVLPVFFHQADACLVTRRGFQTMVELNPQVGRQLQTLVSSPALVPVVFSFRADYTNPLRTQILAKIQDVDATVAGQQFLTLFQCDKLELHNLSVLNNAIELLATHARLLAAPPAESGHAPGLLNPPPNGMTARLPVSGSPPVETGGK